MTGILMDNETGDPVLDDYNNTIQVDDVFAFNQVIDGLFHCKPGSELLHQTYGFPLKEAIRNSSVMDSEMYIESLVVQALDSKLEKMIKNLDFVQATREDNEMIVNVSITSVLDDTITSNIELSESF